MRKTKYKEELVEKICFYLTEGYSNRVAMVMDKKGYELARKEARNE